jgi:geranylgeranyl diphosphate synthase type I
VIDSATLLREIQQELDSFCSGVRSTFAEISDDLSTIPDYVAALLQGGKRFRGQFAFLAWAGTVDRSSLSMQQQDDAMRGMIQICAALEMFHAAALVHDDLLDRSDTRRGEPAMHKRFESAHAKNAWAGSAERFGQAGSVLVGDMMLAWAGEMFAAALENCPDPQARRAARLEFNKMQTEVMAGQFLDVAEENAGPTRARHEAVGRANRVMLYKTAKYSVEAPLLIGAAFAGASDALLYSLSTFAIPLGLAFQLRDDVLGVFGAAEKTGKPVGDDLREGKRTVLVALTRESLPTSVAQLFDDLLAERDLTEAQISHLQQTIADSGALGKTQLMIEELGAQSLEVLHQIELEPSALAALEQLAKKVIDRES